MFRTLLFFGLLVPGIVFLQIEEFQKQTENELGQAQVKLCRSFSLSCSKSRKGSCSSN